MNVFKIILKHYSQIILLENSWAGALIVLGLIIFDFKLGVISLCVSAISLLIAQLIKFNTEDINQGLTGYNPILTSLAVYIFIENFYVALLSIMLSVPLTILLHRWIVMWRTSLPILTVPFILVTWLVLSVAKLFHEYAYLNIRKDIVDIAFFESIVQGFSQIMLIANIWVGILIIIAIAITSIRLCVYTLIGLIVTTITLTLLGIPAIDINDGLFGYNIVLTIIALSGFFYYSMSHIVGMTIGTILSTLIYVALGSVFTLIGLPVLTTPFVLATYIVLIYGKKEPLHK